MGEVIRVDFGSSDKYPAQYEGQTLFEEAVRLEVEHMRAQQAHALGRMSAKDYEAVERKWAALGDFMSAEEDGRVLQEAERIVYGE